MSQLSASAVGALYDSIIIYMKVSDLFIIDSFNWYVLNLRSVFGSATLEKVQYVYIARHSMRRPTMKTRDGRMREN